MQTVTEIVCKYFRKKNMNNVQIWGISILSLMQERLRWSASTSNALLKTKINSIFIILLIIGILVPIKAIIAFVFSTPSLLSSLLDNSRSIWRISLLNLKYFEKNPLKSAAEKSTEAKIQLQKAFCAKNIC